MLKFLVPEKDSLSHITQRQWIAYKIEAYLSLSIKVDGP